MTDINARQWTRLRRRMPSFLTVRSKQEQFGGGGGGGIDPFKLLGRLFRETFPFLHQLLPYVVPTSISFQS